MKKIILFVLMLLFTSGFLFIAQKSFASYTECETPTWHNYCNPTGSKAGHVMLVTPNGDGTYQCADQGVQASCVQSFCPGVNPYPECEASNVTACNPDGKSQTGHNFSVYACNNTWYCVPNDIPGCGLPASTTTTSPAASPPDTSTAPSNPTSQYTTINLAVQLFGIGATGNPNPKHPTRPVHIQIYNSGDDPTQPNVTPVLDSTTQTVTYNNDNGYFLNTSLDLGTTLPAGSYQVLVKTPGYLRKQVVDSQGGKVFTLTPGQTTLLPSVTLIAGDTAPLYNTLDASDFYAIADCYGAKATTSSCAAGSQITDLNDDGVIDGVDLNIWLLGFQTASASQPNAGIEIPGDGAAGN